MQADTVIGIVGAVVLVSVMVGVFAYEYNNVPDDGPAPLTAAEMTAQKMAMFNETFAGFNPDGDLDGDDIPNYNDTDMDGDGLNETAPNGTVLDEEIMQTMTITGSVSAGSTNGVGPAASSGFTRTFSAESGIGHLKLEMSHPVFQAAAGTNNPTLLVTLSTPAGDTITIAPNVSGSTVTYAMESMTDLGEGNYVLNVEMSNNLIATGVNPSTINVTGSLEFHYIPGADE